MHAYYAESTALLPQKCPFDASSAEGEDVQPQITVEVQIKVEQLPVPCPIPILHQLRLMLQETESWLEPSNHIY